MIERKILETNLRNFQVNSTLAKSLKRVGFSSSKLKKTPLGEKITIVASRPGLVVGRKGANIKALTRTLKSQFKLENPQIEIEEVKNQNLDALIIAEKIQSSLERFGTKKFKGVGHKSMEDVMNAGALGVEILLSGKIPSQRAKRWRFYKGYLKKSGDTAVSDVAVAYSSANLKSGTVGIQVRIMLPDTWLPDRVDVHEPEVTSEDVQEVETVVEEITEEGTPEEVSEAEEKAEAVKEAVEVIEEAAEVVKEAVKAEKEVAKVTEKVTEAVEVEAKVEEAAEKATETSEESKKEE